MTDSMDRSVTVVMPVYNAAPWLSQSVGSALDDEWVAEVLLVEDGSADGSLRTCRRLADRFGVRIRILQHSGGCNRGAGATRNLGVREARTPWVAFLDADDFYLPRRFSDTRRTVRAPGTDAVYETVSVLHPETSSAIEDDKGSIESVTMPAGLEPQDVFWALIRPVEGSIHLNGLTVRRDALLRVGLFSPELELGQDVELVWKLALRTSMRAGRLGEPVAVYRRHPSNRSTHHNPRYGHVPFEVALSVARWARSEELSAPHRVQLHRVLAHHIGHWPGPRPSLPRLRVVQLGRWLRAMCVVPSLAVNARIWRHGLSLRATPEARSARKAHRR